MTTLAGLPCANSHAVVAGNRMLKALQAAGKPVMGTCGGEAKCESCHVIASVGRKSLTKIQRVENDKLDDLGASRPDLGQFDICRAKDLTCFAGMGFNCVAEQILVKRGG